MPAPAIVAPPGDAMGGVVVAVATAGAAAGPVLRGDECGDRLKPVAAPHRVQNLVLGFNGDWHAAHAAAAGAATGAGAAATADGGATGTAATGDGTPQVVQNLTPVRTMVPQLRHGPMA